jgi:hypothetical protein
MHQLPRRIARLHRRRRGILRGGSAAVVRTDRALLPLLLPLPIKILRAVLFLAWFRNFPWIKL